MSNTKKSVFFAMPSKSAAMEWAAVQSLLLAINTCQANNWDVLIEVALGSSMLAKERNVLLAQFLESGFTDCMWIDDDVGYTAEGFKRLMEHPVDFVGGAYRYKNDTGQYPVYLKEPLKNTDDLQEVVAIPFGFTRMTRDCALKITEANKDKRFTPKGHDNLTAYVIFDNGYKNGVYMQEDVTFCDKWRAIGEKVYLDANQDLIHVGKKYYLGNLKKDIESNPQ